MADPRRIEIVDAGLLSTVQDLGRPGFAHLGVPPSGALDQPALRLANRLVGNPESAAGMEVTLTGCSFRVQGALRIAVTGARCEISVDRRPQPWGVGFAVPAGSVVVLGPAQDGARSYLAVAGGIEGDRVLGSRSHDQLSGLGGPPLRAGDRRTIGPAAGLHAPGEAVPHRRTSTIGILPGPRQDWCDPRSLAGLDGAEYVLSADSNRIGLRLVGAPLSRRDDSELASEPVVTGAVQLPPSGQPVIFLNDHPTTGGYPVIAVVREEDLPVCAQARPGEVLRFRVIPRR